jgi:hypothetical protein
MSGAENTNLESVLRSVSRRAQVLTGASGVAIALAQNRSMICRASVGPNAPPLGCYLDVTSGFSGQCVRSGRTLRCDDSENDPRVDLANCRRLEIRSILATPILFKGDVVGIIEIFSSRPNAFDDRHVVGLKALAGTVFPTPPAIKSLAAPTLLVETEPALKVFIRNVNDMLRSRAQAPVPLACSPAQFWSDVFVSSEIRWQSFAHSVMLHIIIVAAMGSLLRIASSRAQVVPPRFNRSDVVYYSPAEYLRAARVQMRTATSNAKGGEFAKRLNVVPREQRNKAQSAIAAPDIKLKGDVRVLRLIAWSPVTPSVPASALSRSRLMTPSALVSAISPPPEIKGRAGVRVLKGPPVAVVEPPPVLRGSFVQIRSVGAAPSEVVRPAPQLPVGALSSMYATLKSGLGGASNAVIDPPPSLDGLESAGGQNTGWAPVAEIVPPAPQVFGLGNATRSNPGRTGYSVVPPPPSLSAVAKTAGYTRDLPANDVSSVQRPMPRQSDRRGNRPLQSNAEPGSGATRASSDDRSSGKAKEVSVALLGPVLPLPASSYFSSSEIFLAEERLGNRQKRLVKLVYDFLPYQRRLSEYGPNYPEVDNLRVKRDVTCDETLAQLTSSDSASRPSGAELAGVQYSARSQETMPCFRTTADDYRRARIHARK